jgi:hypothetical protein
MRLATAAALLAAGLSAPALATGGLLCKPVTGAGPHLSLVIGHGHAPGIVCANLKEAGRWHSTCGENDPLIMARRWLDSQRVWVDIIDRREGRNQAKLRALVQPKQRIHTALGTLTRRGKTYKVRCEEG